MAMVTCGGCGSEVSTHAITCPSCGTPVGVGEAPAPTEVTGCEVCGRRDFTVRWVEFHDVIMHHEASAPTEERSTDRQGERRFVQRLVSSRPEFTKVLGLRCRRHRLIRGLWWGARLLWGWHISRAYANFRGGKVDAGRSADFLAELSNQGTESDASKARKLAAKYDEESRRAGGSG